MEVILCGNLYINFYNIISFTFGVWSLLVFGRYCVFIILTVFFLVCQGLCALTFAVALVLLNLDLNSAARLPETYNLI